MGPEQTSNQVVTSLLTLLMMSIGISMIVAGRKGPPAVLKFIFAPLWNLVKCKANWLMRRIWMAILGH